MIFISPATSFTRGSQRAATISVSRRSGVFYVNKGSVRATKLSEGDSVAIGKSEDDRNAWYLCLVPGCFKLRKHHGGLGFCSVAAADAFLKDVGVPERVTGAVTMDIVSVPTKVDGVSAFRIKTEEAKWK